MTMTPDELRTEIVAAYTDIIRAATDDATADTHSRYYRVAFGRDIVSDNALSGFRMLPEIAELVRNPDGLRNRADELRECSDDDIREYLETRFRNERTADTEIRDAFRSVFGDTPDTKRARRIMTDLTERIIAYATEIDMAPVRLAEIVADAFRNEQTTNG